MISDNEKAGVRGGRIVAFVVLCVVGFLGLLGYLQYKDENTNLGWAINSMFGNPTQGDGGGDIPVQIPEKDPSARFYMLDMSMGMSPNEVRTIYPDMEVSELANGETRGMFGLNEANYMVWFLDREQGQKAYRMRYDQTFPDDNDDRLIDELAHRLGHPTVTDCQWNDRSKVQVCNFHWWPTHGVSVGVTSTVTMYKNKDNWTRLSLDAVDTYLEGRKMRRKSKKIGKSLDFGIK